MVWARLYHWCIVYSSANPAAYMADHLGGLVAGFALLDVPPPLPYWLAVAVARLLDTLTDSLSAMVIFWLLVSMICVLLFGVVSAVMYPRVDGTRCNRKMWRR